MNRQRGSIKRQIKKKREMTKQHNSSQQEKQTQPTSQQYPHRRYRTIARVAAVQALFQSEQNNDDIEIVIQQFLKHRMQGAKSTNTLYEEGYILGADKNLFQHIARHAMQNKEGLLKEIRRVLPKTWSLERLDPVLRAIFLAASSEAKSSSIDVAVLINEYVDIAHSFFVGSEPQLVNGVLDALFHARRLQRHSEATVLESCVPQTIALEEKVFSQTKTEAG